jgi:hypothetical protein
MSEKTPRQEFIVAVAEFVNANVELARKAGWREGEESLFDFAERLINEAKLK